MSNVQVIIHLIRASRFQVLLALQWKYLDILGPLSANNTWSLSIYLSIHLLTDNRYAG